MSAKRQLINVKCLESNEVLKLKFQKLHRKVLDNVDPVSVINFFFQEAVISAANMKALMNIRDDPQRQCNELLALLHTSGNPQAFVKLYVVIKEEKSLEWLVEDIDKFTDQSLVDLLQQLYVSEPTGKTSTHARLRPSPSVCLTVIF